MNHFITLKIALRFSQTKKRSRLVSLISILSTFGIMLGVAALIIGLSAMNGFQKELNERVLSVIPHAQIFGDGEYLDHWHAIEKKLVMQPDVTSVMPYINLMGLAENKNTLKPLAIQGLNINKIPTNWSLPHYIDSQAWANFIKDPNGKIILGQGLARELNVKEGQWITLLLPVNNQRSSTFQQPKRLKIQVAGILALSGDLGYKLGIMPLQQMQSMLDIGDSVMGLSLNVKDLFGVNKRVSTILNQLDYPVQARTWINSYGYMYQDIQMIRMIMYIAMVLVIGIACFNIVSTLIIAVKDKQADIAILRTLGAKHAFIRSIFIWYGFISGLFGCILGVILGSLISINLSVIINLLEKITHQKYLADDIYFINYVPSELHGSDVMIVVITAVILSLLASWYPARQACRINPAEILNGS